MKKKTRKVSAEILTNMISTDAFIRRLFGIPIDADIHEVVMIPVSGGAYETTIAYKD